MKSEKSVILCVGIAAMVLYGAFVLIRAHLAEKSVADTAEATVRAIANPWSYETIEGKLSLASKASPPQSMLDKVTAASSLLGNMQQLTSKPTCKLTLGVDTYSQREYTYAKCQMEILFQKGSGKIFLTLVQQSDQWRINDFIIDDVKPL